MVVAIYESTVAMGVTVKVNGTDRTSALGGGSGFNSSQTVLELVSWMNIGALSTVDHKPTGLGRIVEHPSWYGYVQAA